MSSFTEAEQAYLELFTRTKDSLPKAYSSIKNIEITDKDSLMKTLLYFPSINYSNSSSVYIASELLRNLPGTLRAYTLEKKGLAINLTKKRQEDKYTLLDTLFDQMMAYLPTLSILRNQIQIQTGETKQFLNHLEINRDLLLRGPPNANTHTINSEKAAVWVSKQKTAERQRLAQLLLENLRYIPHSELLTALQICVKKAKEQLVDGPVTFIVGSPKKSNYYISLLFAHFWLAEGLPIDSVLQKFSTQNPGGNYLDIDDMSYSASQAEKVLSINFRAYCNHLRDQIKPILELEEGYKNTYMFLPRHIVEASLQTTGFHYLLVRAFMSEYSFHRLTGETWYAPRFPLQIVTSEIIPYMPSVNPKDIKKIEYLFNNPVYSTVYFDHKVADMASTFLLPIAAGIVPERMIYLNQDPTNLNASLVNTIKGDGLEFFPFIEHCSPEERDLPKDRNNLWASEMADRYRCPVAWYKEINYSSGTYTKKGGTRKQKKRCRQKTRSTSK